MRGVKRKNFAEISRRLYDESNQVLILEYCTNDLAAKVELFGSFANTFTIANSDIDCCVTSPKSTSDQIQRSGLPKKLQVELDALGTTSQFQKLTS